MKEIRCIQAINMGQLWLQETEVDINCRGNENKITSGLELKTKIDGEDYLVRHSIAYGILDRRREDNIPTKLIKLNGEVEENYIWGE